MNISLLLFSFVTMNHILWFFNRLLSNATNATIVSAFILSRIDYCISLLCGFTDEVTFYLQQIRNYASQVILCIRESANITTHLKSLLLPVIVSKLYKTCLCKHCHSSRLTSKTLPARGVGRSLRIPNSLQPQTTVPRVCTRIHHHATQLPKPYPIATNPS